MTPFYTIQLYNEFYEVIRNIEITYLEIDLDIYQNYVITVYKYPHWKLAAFRKSYYNFYYSLSIDLSRKRNIRFYIIKTDDLNQNIITQSLHKNTNRIRWNIKFPNTDLKNRQIQTHCPIIFA